MDAISQRESSVAPEQHLQLGTFSAKEIIEQGIGFARRQYPTVLFIAACAIALTVVYLWTAPRLYTAHAMFLIDTTKMQVLQQQQQVLGELPLDAAQVDTQIEVLKSDRIGLSVIRDLKLTGNPEFVGSQRGIVGTLIGLILSPFSSSARHDAQPVASEDERVRRALGRFRASRDVKRLARTYVLDISYTARNPGTAASVANAIADAYLVDQLDAKFQASRRASKWLEDRIAELRDQARAADRAVLEFKEKNNIIETGSSKNNDGRLLSDQRVIDLNAELAKARADMAEAKARLDRIEIVIKQADVPDAAVADSLNNSIISALRTQYLDYDRRAQVYASRYGAQHLAVINLETQKAQLRRSMADELKRIAESYKSSYEIAQSRAGSLESSLNLQISGAQLANRELLGLGELESKAKAYHSIHDSFLQRFMEVTQQQSLPITEARVLTAAAAPVSPSSPNSSRIMFIGSVLGLMLGIAAASLRESIDRVFRTTQQVERVLGTNCLTVLPEVKASPAAAAKNSQVPAVRAPGPWKELEPPAQGLFRQVINEPLSTFAEGFRAVKVAADISRAIKQNTVIGITSSVPGEGKSTVSSNFAQLIAHGGRKAILIDCDLRNPTLTRKLTPKADTGLLEVLAGKVELDHAAYRDNLTGLVFLPAVIESRLAHSSEILASDALKQLIDQLRKTYYYVIIDLPPLGPVVDVRTTTQLIDSYVFVVEWGRTRTNFVQRQLASTPELFARLLGIVLNKANLKILDRYEDYYGRYYYAKNYYERYGNTQ